MALEEYGEKIGTRVGHFRLVGFLGEGGMGAVYVGFDEKLQRKVALKSVHAGRLDTQSRARFLREARTLSQLHHPNICAIHDYLEGEERDFLVLELIEGRSLVELQSQPCDRAVALQITRQLAAVLAATHAKGIIHRDLKPANIMWTPEGRVKVLDFGLAREVVDLNETTLDPGAQTAAELDAGATSPEMTAYGSVLGTLSYMSPEQARGEAVTPASDLFSLGLILQELFTGQPARRTEGDRNALLARARAGESEPLSGLDPGLEPDLAALIERLKDPAPAVRPSALDTVERLDWIAGAPGRRLRRALAWVGAALLALVAGAMSWQAYRIFQEAERANREAAGAREVSEFLVDVFAVSDPEANLGETVTARELLDRAGRDIDQRLAEQPAIKSQLLSTLSRAYEALGIYDPALAFAEQALALRERSDAVGPLAVPDAIERLATVRLRRGDLAEAEQLSRRLLAMRESLLSPDSQPVGAALSILGTVLSAQKKLPEAEASLRRALTIAEQQGDGQSKSVFDCLNELTAVLSDAGNFAAAEETAARAVRLAERIFGAAHPVTGGAFNNSGALYAKQQKYVEALPLLERSLEIDERVFGPDHPSVAQSAANVGGLERMVGRYAKAEAHLRRALAIQERIFGHDRGPLAPTLTNLGSVMRELGKGADAELMMRRALAIDERTTGTDSPSLVVPLLQLGTILRDARRADEARVTLERARTIVRTSLGADHPLAAFVLRELAALERDGGRPAVAEPLLREALALREKALGPDHPETAGILVDLAELLHDAGRAAESAAALDRALAVFATAAEGSMRPGVRTRQARALELAGRRGEARELTRALVATGRRTPDLLALCRTLDVPWT
jgi:serine/threonine-protein kinase